MTEDGMEQNSISALEAQTELAAREMARRDILRFGVCVLPKFRIYAHQKLIAEKLNRVAQFVRVCWRRCFFRRGRSVSGRIGNS